ncbi:MAG: 50S ribosomal protein L25 [Clostridiales bacterium]|nr:50S ribosomal protein L25 [Clostridiales bacterium]
MAEIGTLKVEERVAANTGANKRMRREGYVPGNIFGKGTESKSVSVRKDEFRRALNKFGRNAVFKLSDDNNDYTVMVKEIQLTPLVNEFQHIDFQLVSLSEETKSEVPVRVSGKEAVEAKRLIVMLQTDIVNVKGLPQEIPDSIEVDVSKLGIGDVITIKELVLPKGITAEDDPDHVVLSINESRTQAVEVEEVEEVGSEEVAAE